MSARACHVAAIFTTLALGAALSGCDLENPGDEAPVGSLYFPNALVISNEAEGAPRFLFVASTNFDLRYTSGALHAFSLDAIDAEIQKCADDNNLGAETCPIELSAALADEVLIPTYATALAIDPDGKRIVVSSRTDDRLTTIKVNLDADDAAVDGTNPVASDLLGCESAASRGCGTGTTNGIDSVTRDNLVQPEAPSDLVIGRLSELTGDPDDDARDYVATAHQRGAVSLYLEEDTGLQLSSVLEDLGRTPTGIARDPVSGLFHVTLRTNQMLRVGVTLDTSGELVGTRRYNARLYNATSVSIAGVALNQLRSVAFLKEPVGLGVTEGGSQALIIANDPSALVLANVAPGAGSSSAGRVQRVAEIGAGGARLALGSIGGRPLAAVTCLDGRSIYIVDLTSMETRAVVPNLSGPFGVAFDEARERLYATDFRSSVVRIVDLSQLASSTAAPESVRVVATLGRPRVVQELK